MSRPKRITVLLLIVAIAFVFWLANRHTSNLSPNRIADRIVVWKSDRKLSLVSNEDTLWTYSISLGREPVGSKTREGDNKTPEGEYIIDSRMENSAFHLSLHITYPDSAAIANAETGGYDPGGAIMIHGLRNGLGWIGKLHLLFDWTRGCIAVTNLEIEEIWRACPNGTPITIYP